MNRFSKLIMLFLVFSLATGGLAIADSEAAALAEPQIIAKITALGLLDGQKPSDIVTRADFAQLISNMLGLKGTELAEDSGTFYDVTKNNPAYNDIELLCHIGVIKPNSGRFRPYEPVAYAEAVQMLVSALGYDVYAQAKGGYPSGYFIAARENKIIPGSMNKSSNDSLTYSDVALMLNSAIDAKILKNKSFGQKQEYQADHNATVLSEYHQIYTVKGVLDAVGGIRVNAGMELSDGQAEIDGTIFKTGQTAPEGLLGYNVKAYYSDKNGDNTLLYVEENASRNTVVDIGYNLVDHYKLGTLYYWQDENKTKLLSATIMPSINAVINDKPTSTFTKDDFQNADRIILIDNNSDGRYDVMRMYIEEIFTVSSVDTNKNKVYDKYMPANGASAVLDLDEKGYRKISITDVSGNAASLSDIGEWSVLTVCRDREQTRIKVTVSNQAISGTVEELAKEPTWDTSKITVDGKVYEFSKNAPYIDGLDNLKLGDMCEFYLDSHGRIAGFKHKEQTSENYGYLIRAQKQSGVGDSIEFKLFTAKEEFEIFLSADSMEIDGAKGLKGDDIINALRINESGVRTDNISPKPIRYRLTGDNRLNYIDTPYRGANEDVGSQLDYGNNTLTRYREFSGGCEYNRGTNTFGGKLRVGADTKVICVPFSPKYIDDITYYAFKDYTYFNQIADTRKINMTAYDVSKDRTANLIVITGNNGGGKQIDEYTPVTIVTNITKGVGRNGGIIYILNGYQDGNLISVPFEEGFDITKKYISPSGPVSSTIRRGDLIRYGVNGKGEINSYDKLFSLNDEDDPNIVWRGNEVNSNVIKDTHPSLVAYTTNPNSPHKYYNGRVFMQSGNEYYFYGVKFMAAFGTVLDKDGSMLYITGTIDGRDTSRFNEIYDVSKGKVYMIDQVNDQIYLTSVDEVVAASDVGLNNASQVLYYTYSAVPGGLVIIKRR